MRIDHSVPSSDGMFGLGNPFASRGFYGQRQMFGLGQEGAAEAAVMKELTAEDKEVTPGGPDILDDRCDQVFGMGMCSPGGKCPLGGTCSLGQEMFGMGQQEMFGLGQEAPVRNAINPNMVRCQNMFGLGQAAPATTPWGAISLGLIIGGFVGAVFGQVGASLGSKLVPMNVRIKGGR